METKKAHLILPNQSQIELDVYTPTLGYDVIDVSKLGANGYFTYDPGFTSTAACQSAITYIDGDKGILMHRGYKIEDLVEKHNFMDLCHLLMYDDLPQGDRKKEFEDIIRYHTLMNDQVRTFYYGFQRDAHPMAMICAVVGALSAFYHDSLDIHNPKDRQEAVHKLIAKIPTIATMAYNFHISRPFVYPKNKYSFAGNFLHMLFSNPSEDYELDPLEEKIMDVIFMLHADHEQNASTTAVRVAGSSGANTYACIAAGIATLWGPSHGGANEAVINMIDEIKTLDRVDEFIAKAKDKNDSFRLMGFGHRVYKNFDPRARILKKLCDDYFDKKGISDPTLEIAKKIEQIALEDEYFIEKKLYPNVDFYSGILLKALGIPTIMFTPIFAVARTVGWACHWNEMLSEKGSLKIARPRQLYTGNPIKNL